MTDMTLMLGGTSVPSAGYTRLMAGAFAQVGAPGGGNVQPPPSQSPALKPPSSNGGGTCTSGDVPSLPKRFPPSPRLPSAPSPPLLPEEPPGPNPLLPLLLPHA